MKIISERKEERKVERKIQGDGQVITRWTVSRGELESVLPGVPRNPGPEQAEYPLRPTLASGDGTR